MFPFNSPTTMVLTGCTQSGKTTWIKRLVQNLDDLFPLDPPKSVLYCYAIFQPVFTEMQSEHIKVEFHEGVPSEDTINSYKKENPGHCIIILDDLMQTICHSKTIENVFTRGSHHQNITVLYVNQNLFCQGKSSISITRNAHYVILFECADLLQIEIFGKQMGKSKSQVLMEAYMDVISEPYGYLIIDRSPRRNRLYQFRSKVFPGEDTIVYTEK